MCFANWRYLLKKVCGFAEKKQSIKGNCLSVLRFVLSRGFVQSLDFSAVGKAADTGKQIGEISS
jgi:hypothetical protein